MEPAERSMRFDLVVEVLFLLRIFVTIERDTFTKVAKDFVAF